LATSGTVAFNPAIGALTLYAFSLCGIRRTAILQEHMADARMAAGLMLTSWDNDTPNLWRVDLVTETLVEGTATYAVDPSVIMVLDAYIRTGEGDTQTDRIIWPVSRTEYAAYPNKELQAPPTSFWFDRLLSPTITMWPVPDGQQGYELHYYAVFQTQDANLANGETADVPPRWLDAFSWGLAARLAVSYAPDRAVALDAKAKEALEIARQQDVENTPMYLAPAIGGYYR